MPGGPLSFSQFTFQESLECKLAPIQHLRITELPNGRSEMCPDVLLRFDSAIVGIQLTETNRTLNSLSIDLGSATIGIYKGFLFGV